MFNALYPSDRRMHNRTACDLRAEWDDASGYVRNFGKGGALIETTGKNDSQVGQEIFMAIAFKGRPHDLILKARVAWARSDCLGVTFQKE